MNPLGSHSAGNSLGSPRMLILTQAVLQQLKRSSLFSSVQAQSLLSSASHPLSYWQGRLKIFIYLTDLVTVFSDAILVFILKEISNFVLQRNIHPSTRNFFQAELAFISSSDSWFCSCADLCNASWLSSQRAVIPS